jgi:hypothetical protein
MRNLLHHQNFLQCRARAGRVYRRWAWPLLALVVFSVLGVASARAQSTGDPTPNALELGPRCPTCSIVIPARPLSPKDREDRDDRNLQKRNFNVANAARKRFIDDETGKMLILARDLKIKVDGLGRGRPSPIMQREATVIEFLAKDIKEKMKLTVNPD